MSDLETKFQVQNSIWSNELEQAQKQLNTMVVTDEDIKLLAGEQTQTIISELKYNKKDILIERLKEALTKATMTQEDVCNLLANDLYEREKMAYQLANARDN